MENQPVIDDKLIPQPLEFFGSPKTVNDLPEYYKQGLYDQDIRKEILLMHQVISEFGFWDVLRVESPPKGQGFMFWQSNWVSKVNHDKRIEDCGHSGASCAFCWRVCKYIAVNGYEHFQKEAAELELQRKVATTF